MKKKEANKLSTKAQYVIGGIVVFIFALSVVSTINGNSNKKNNEITQEIAEKVCQEEATIKMQGTGVKVISFMNYNPQFGRSGQASDGTDQYMLYWNGKTNNGQNSLQFVCNISGTVQNPRIDSLQYGATRLE